MELLNGIAKFMKYLDQFNLFLVKLLIWERIAIARDFLSFVDY